MTKTLITGAGGYLGARIARKRLLDSQESVILWLHAADTEEFERKKGLLVPQFAEFGNRVEFAGGELTAERPFVEVLPEAVTRIVHTAALTQFNIDEKLGGAVNIDGSSKLFSFARKCPNLENILFLSSIYASGLREGDVPENLLDDSTGFANHYEWSKWGAERCLQQEYGDLPWTIARTATVIANDTTGSVTQFNAIHNTLRLLYYGLVSLLPGAMDTPVYVVTGDFAANAVSRLTGLRGKSQVYHVCHGRSESIELGGFLDLVMAAYRADRAFAKSGIKPPIFCDLQSFRLLAEEAERFSGGVVRQAVGSVAAFAQQLYIVKDIANDRMRCVMEDYSAPDAAELVGKTCRWLVTTRWGREVSDDAA